MGWVIRQWEVSYSTYRCGYVGRAVLAEPRCDWSTVLTWGPEEGPAVSVLRTKAKAFVDYCMSSCLPDTGTGGTPPCHVCGHTRTLHAGVLLPCVCPSAGDAVANAAHATVGKERADGARITHGRAHGNAPAE